MNCANWQDLGLSITAESTSTIQLFIAQDRYLGRVPPAILLCPGAPFFSIRSARGLADWRQDRARARPVRPKRREHLVAVELHMPDQVCLRLGTARDRPEPREPWNGNSPPCGAGLLHWQRPVRPRRKRSPAIVASASSREGIARRCGGRRIRVPDGWQRRRGSGRRRPSVRRRAGGQTPACARTPARSAQRHRRPR